MVSKIQNGNWNIFLGGIFTHTYTPLGIFNKFLRCFSVIPPKPQWSSNVIETKMRLRLEFVNLFIKQWQIQTHSALPVLIACLIAKWLHLHMASNALEKWFSKISLWWFNREYYTSAFGGGGRGGVLDWIFKIWILINMEKAIKSVKYH